MITLYIEDLSLRVLRIKRNKAEKWAEMELDPSLVKEGVISDEDGVAGRIKQLFKVQGIEEKKANVALSGMGCLIHPIIIPSLSRALMAKAISQEMERLVPVPLEQFYLSWQVISTRKEQKQVLVVASPRNAVDALVKTIRQAGLEAQRIELKPLALTKTVREASAVIVDVQAAEFDIVIVVDGLPQAIRTLSFPQDIHSWAEKRLVLLQELDRTFKYCESSILKEPLSPDIPVYISGELVSEPGASEDMAEQLKRRVLPLQPPLKCPPEIPLNRYMVNLCLSFKSKLAGNESRTPGVNLNVLPDVYRPKPPSVVNVFAPPIVVVSIAWMAMMGMQANNDAIVKDSIQAQIKNVNHNIANDKAVIQTQAKEIATLEKQISDITARSKTFNAALASFKSGQTKVNDELMVITDTLPEVVNLTSTIYGSSGVTLSGTASSEDEILAYASALRATGRFSQVVISSINRKISGMSFIFVLAR